MERILRTPKVNGVKPRIVSFRFFPNGSNTDALTTAAGTLRDPCGVVTNVARSAQGNFLVTMADPAYKVIDAMAQYQAAADNVDLYAQAGDISNENTSSPMTFVVKLKTGATSTDPPATNTNSSVMCVVWIEDSTGANV